MSIRTLSGVDHSALRLTDSSSRPDVEDTMHLILLQRGAKENAAHRLDHHRVSEVKSIHLELRGPGINDVSTLFPSSVKVIPHRWGTCKLFYVKGGCQQTAICNAFSRQLSDRLKCTYIRDDTHGSGDHTRWDSRRRWT